MRRWSKEEIDFLINNWGVVDDEIIINKLGRSKKAIECKALDLGLKKFESKWNDETDKFLIDNWDKMTLCELASAIGVAKSTVEDRAYNILKLEQRVPKWTKEQEEYLEFYWLRLPTKDIARIVGKNEKSVKAKAMRMGLEKRVKKWTKEEDKYLKDKWGTVKIHTIAYTLKRTVRAVEIRAGQLNLGPQLSWYSLKEIADMIGVHSTSIRNRILKSNFKHHRSKTKQRAYMLDDEQLRRFLKQNQDLWHYDNLSINIFDSEMPWLKAKKEADRNKTKKYKKIWTDEDSFRLIDMLRNGYTYEEIAKALNRTVEGVKGHHRYKYRCRY